MAYLFGPDEEDTVRGVKKTSRMMKSLAVQFLHFSPNMALQLAESAKELDVYMKRYDEYAAKTKSG